jgi:hypothetical protein
VRPKPALATVLLVKKDFLTSIHSIRYFDNILCFCIHLSFVSMSAFSLKSKHGFSTTQSPGQLSALLVLRSANIIFVLTIFHSRQNCTSFLPSLHAEPNMEGSIAFYVNGRRRQIFAANPRMTLLEYLRSPGTVCGDPLNSAGVVSCFRFLGALN